MVGDAIGVLAGFIVELVVDMLLAGFIVELPVLDIFEAGGAIGVAIGVLIGAGVEAFIAGFALTLTFVPESPQAIPRALKPRTVESTITFVILFSDS